MRQIRHRSNTQDCAPLLTVPCFWLQPCLGKELFVWLYELKRCGISLVFGAKDIEFIWDVPTFAAARAITDAASICTSTGKAFGCAAAESQAAAWASATAEAYASAYAEAFNGCGVCGTAGTKVEATAEVLASTSQTLVVDVYSHAEVLVCVEANQSSSIAFSNCFATAYTRFMRSCYILTANRRVW